MNPSEDWPFPKVSRFTNSDFSSLRELKKEFQDLLKTAEHNGYLTADDINDACGDHPVTPSMIDDIYTALSELDIEVLDQQDESRHLNHLANQQHRLQEASRIVSADLFPELFAHFRKHPEKMYSLRPRQFEELIASILKQFGYAVELTPQTRDGGTDIIAVQKSIITGPNFYLVECKRYKRERRVAVGTVRSLLGVVESQRGTKGLVVTTSFFTRDARQFAATNEKRMDLSDFDKIVSWLNQLHAGPQTLSERVDAFRYHVVSKHSSPLDGRSSP
jgi:HJR/Mrr/RecB family endonuclease